jgi:hypothetical protein
VVALTDPSTYLTLQTLCDTWIKPTTFAGPYETWWDKSRSKQPAAGFRHGGQTEGYRHVAFPTTARSGRAVPKPDDSDSRGDNPAATAETNRTFLDSAFLGLHPIVRRL